MQKPRRASLLPAVYRDSARNIRAFLAQPSVVRQRLLILPAGRYGALKTFCKTRNFVDSNAP
jgi:hypothetical protein